MWLFLLHEILVLLPIDRLTWFMYWAYVPVSFGSAILAIISVKKELKLEANKEK